MKKKTLIAFSTFLDDLSDEQLEEGQTQENYSPEKELAQLLNSKDI